MVIMTKLTVIGGGLAGSEAAWQAAESGLEVDLYEMRPGQSTGAHQSADLAELVGTDVRDGASAARLRQQQTFIDCLDQAPPVEEACRWIRRDGLLDERTNEKNSGSPTA